MMNRSRRKFLHLAAGAAALPVLSRRASALDYPTRPVRIVVGFPAGGPTDFHARLIGPWLSQRLGQSFIVENIAGAGGNIGAEAAIRAPADGYTLLLATTANSINASLYRNLKFSFVRDAAPVAGIIRSQLVVEVNPSFPAKSLAEFIAYARANPDSVNYASAGNGSPQHVAAELFKMMTKVNMVHVPYRGEAPALTDLIGGHVQAMFGTITASLPHIRDGKLRALSVTGDSRSAALPSLPTVGESVPGYEADTWAGICAPHGTPAEVIARLNREVNAGLDSSGIKARYADLAETTIPGSPSDLGKFIANDTAKWAGVIKFANIKAE